MNNISMQSPDADPANSAQQKQVYDLSTFRALIVEDYEFIADLLAASLREMGVGTVIKAADGAAAKDFILNYNAEAASTNFDIIIMDWLMPKMGGLELLQWIRSHSAETIRFLPVIVCSAYADRALVETSRDNGATEVLVKPVSADKVVNRMQHVIEHPRSYIKAKKFFGPDRRRKELSYNGEERRLMTAEDIQQHVEELT